jgi:hypothetical protein
MVIGAEFVVGIIPRDAWTETPILTLLQNETRHCRVSIESNTGTPMPRNCFLELLTQESDRGSFLHHLNRMPSIASAGASRRVARRVSPLYTHVQRYCKFPPLLA